MDTPHEPPPRSQFEINRPRLMGRFAILGGILAAIGGPFGVSRSFDAPMTGVVTSLFIALTVVGFWLIYIGTLSLLRDPDEVPSTGFVAWGRLAGGAAMTVLAVSARIVLRYFPEAPLEAVVPAIMCQIAGPVLMAWASYATFILDSDQADTGLVLIVVFLALIPVLFLL